MIVDGEVDGAVIESEEAGTVSVKGSVVNQRAILTVGAPVPTCRVRFACKPENVTGVAHRRHWCVHGAWARAVVFRFTAEFKGI